jgi:hypothetical protein
MRRCFLIYATPRGSFLSSQGVQRALLVRPRADNGEKKTATSRAASEFMLFFSTVTFSKVKSGVHLNVTREMWNFKTHTHTHIRPIDNVVESAKFSPVCTRKRPRQAGRATTPRRPNFPLFTQTPPQRMPWREKAFSPNWTRNLEQSHNTLHNAHSALSLFDRNCFNASCVSPQLPTWRSWETSQKLLINMNYFYVIAVCYASFLVVSYKNSLKLFLTTTLFIRKST